MSKLTSYDKIGQLNWRRKSNDWSYFASNLNFINSVVRRWMRTN